MNVIVPHNIIKYMYDFNGENPIIQIKDLTVYFFVLPK